MSLYALVPAAGRGERFGGAKLLTRWNNREILGHVLATLAALQREGILTAIVVLHRSGDQPIAQLATQYRAIPLPVNESEGSLAATLRAGLAGVAQYEPAPRPDRGERTAILICLGDQPLIRRDVIRALVREWEAGGTVIRPVYLEAASVPGHPVLLDRTLWPLATDLRGEEGFGPVLERHGIRIRTIRVEGGNPDVDTADDLLALDTSGLGRSS
ncbi:MAG: nucleotidyltransferase family protein [Gemmatimonadales bacterium]